MTEPKRDRILPARFTPDEHVAVLDSAERSGRKPAEWLADVGVAVARTGLRLSELAAVLDAAADPANQRLGNVAAASELETEQDSSKNGESSTKKLVKTPHKPQDKTQKSKQISDNARERGAQGEVSTGSLVPKTETGVGSSLRSSQARTSAAEVNDSPWRQPEPNKLHVVLSDGTRVNNIWLFANGCRISPADADRIANTVFLKPLRAALVKCFAMSLRKCYIRRWCAIYGRRTSAWCDTSQASRGFLRAAEFLLQEYIQRGMQADQFLDACHEMRPKSLRFPTVDMLGGATGSRVAAWIPPEQREADKPWNAHEDKDGTQWVTLPGESPIQVIRTKADRERLLKANKAD